MPPKIKITEDNILDAAIKLIREKNWESINARLLANELNCSTQPIFRLYVNMDELKSAVYKRVEKIYNEHIISNIQNKDNAFLSMGLAYINFAKNEKQLFKLLFMSNYIKVKSIKEIVEDEDNEIIVSIISQMTNLSKDKAKTLFINTWLVTHGIASMLATNSCDFSDEEIKSILIDSFNGYILVLNKKEQ